MVSTYLPLPSDKCRDLIFRRLSYSVKAGCFSFFFVADTGKNQLALARYGRLYRSQHFYF